jgi:HK97 family phage major capsid protein
VENVIVRSEPLTYREGGAYSYFHDRTNSVMGDGKAAERLARHAVEMRTNPNGTAGTGGEFDVPAWLVDRFAGSVNAGRPLADLCRPLPLPVGVSSVHIPRITTGASAGIQAGQAGAVSTTDMVTADATSPVVTIAGQVDVSQQLFDLTPSGFDVYAYSELMGSYNATLEAQLIAGTGSNGQLRGVTNVSSITTVSGASATTWPLLYPLLGKAAAGVGNARLLPPEVWLMAPRRWFWMTTLLDTTNQRPALVPGDSPQRADYMPAGGASPVGPLLGLPVYLDGGIAAGTATDEIICCRPSDMLLFESAPKFIATPMPLGGTLQMRLSLHKYVAFVATRYPSAIGQVSALAQPSGF